MSQSYRRFEILLPRRFDDQQPVPEALIADTLHELEQQLGIRKQPFRGFWRNEERSEFVRVYLDVADDPANQFANRDFGPGRLQGRGRSQPT